MSTELTATTPITEEMPFEDKVQVVLERIKPALESDGGSIELVRTEENSARVRLVGACATCPSSMMTLTMGVERALQTEIPEFDQLHAVSPWE